MAFLAAGHVPGEPGPYRDNIERGIRYVLDHQQPNGVIASNMSNGPMYCHGISTLMLAEVVGMLDDGELAEQARAALARAVKVIVAAQDRRREGPRRRLAVPAQQRRQRPERHRLAAHGPPRRPVGRLRGPLRAY